jgi:membrane protease subunit HflC
MRLIHSLVALLILILLVVYLSAFTVNQTQQGIVLHLGKIKKNAQGMARIYTPGLHFKTPFITTVKKFDMRLRTLSITSSRIMTVEQKDLMVDAFVKWRISNLVKYYKATSGDAQRANMLLSQKVSAKMRAEFGQQTILELVAEKRASVMDLLRTSANSAATPLGIQVIDVRIKSMNLPAGVTNSVYQRMRSNREKEASLIRAQGEEKAERIKAGAEASVTVILSKAKATGAAIRAKGQAEAAKIYAGAYQKNAHFYDFYRSLEAYQGVFANKSKTLLLQDKGAFFKFFKDPGISMAPASHA